MAYTDIKTIASDLRITKNNIGSFLSVDDSCNLVWTDSRITSTGGVWQYNIVEKDCYIILPSAKLHAGLCVAIMRGKTTRDRNEQSGIESSKANPKVVIFPYNNNTSGKGTPDFDYIQGGPNFYCSNGIKWNSSTNSYVINDLEWDEFSSVMFKSVYCGKDRNGIEKYSWTIINGVGSWDAEELGTDENPLPLQVIKASTDEGGLAYPQFAVTAQTASVNSLSASTETTTSEFLALESINESALSIRKSDGTTKILAPQCSTTIKEITKDKDDKEIIVDTGKFIKTNSYIIGRFMSDTTTRRAVLHTEFDTAGVNIFGPGATSNTWKPFDNDDKAAVNSIKAEDINGQVNWLGYIYDNNNDHWWASLKERSFSKRMGFRQKGVITEPEGDSAQVTKYLAVAQVVIPIDFSKIKVLNQTSSTASSIKTIYAMIQSFFDTYTSKSSVPYTNVFKVPKDCYAADDEGLEDSDIVTISSSGLGESNTTNGFGTILGIPVTSEDRAAGGINLVIEFIYKTFADGSPVQFDTEELFKTEYSNPSDQYVLMNFIGIESLKPVSISPEVEFENFGLSQLNNRGDIIIGSDEINNSFLDANAKNGSEPETGYYIGQMVPYGSYDYISIQGGSTSRTFFDSSSRYYPSDNITKTILEYDTGFDIATEAGDAAIKAKLVIDWANRKYQFDGSIRVDGEEFTGTLNNTFNETAASITFYRNGAKGKTLSGAIHIQYNGMVKMPWLCIDHELKKTDAGIVESSRRNARVNITNYKTVVHASGSVETLIDYRCGWERAETKWEPTAYTDGSEYDGLISDYSSLATDSATTSPSKSRIKPSHKMVLASNTSNFSNSDSALLPYLQNNTTDASKSIRYFATDWKNKGLNQTNISSTTNKSVVANPFCALEFTPSLSGILVCNVELPIQSGLSSTGYLILKEISNSEATQWSDYTLIKDSGTSINARSNPGYTKMKISFTDNVVENYKLRYTIIIYDAPWTESTITDKTKLIYKASNSVIVRYRPSEQSLGITADGINDFKSLFDTGNYQGPQTQTGLTVNSIFNIDDSSSSSTDSSVRYTDDTDFNASKFSTMMFGVDADQVIGETTNKNHGACFSFHAYVLKEGV